MSGYALTPLARADIFETWFYIAENNEAAADRVEQAIYAACELRVNLPCAAISDRNSLLVPFDSGP